MTNFHGLFVYRSVLYGGLGVHLASAIVSSVLPLNVYYGADGKLLQMDNVAMNQSLLAYRNPIEFLTNDLIHSARITELMANRTSLSTLNHITAIHQAYSVSNFIYTLGNILSSDYMNLLICT